LVCRLAGRQGTQPDALSGDGARWLFAVRRLQVLPLGQTAIYLSLPAAKPSDLVGLESVLINSWQQPIQTPHTPPPPSATSAELIILLIDR